MKKIKPDAYKVGGKSFRTKTEIREYVKSILKRYVSGRILNKNDEEFIISLLENHPSKDEKIGCGIERIEVRFNPPKHNGFWIIRKDGTQIDFSYLVCIGGSSIKSDCKSVARNEVVPFILEFKQDFFQDNEYNICPITGKEISFLNSHVHHSNESFDNLFNEFFKDINLDSIKIVDSGAINKLFADRKLAKEWCEFHNSRAKLQVVSVIANLSILEKGRKFIPKYKTGGIKR